MGNEKDMKKQTGAQNVQKNDCGCNWNFVQSSRPVKGATKMNWPKPNLSIKSRFL